jgi:5-methylcytosine-specific restriction endonuclease McrA
MKICTQCFILKDESKFYFHKSRKIYESKCKECTSINGKRYRQEHREIIAIRNKEWQKANREKYLASMKKWREANHDMVIIGLRKWKKANPDKVAAFSKKYYENNREAILTGCKKYYENNREKVLAKCKRWRINNPMKARAIKKRRNAMKIGATVYDLECSDWQGLLRVFANHCAYCGKAETDVGLLTQDHIIPVSRGGDHTMINIVPACVSCNSKKGNKTLEEWRSI